jgi:DNA-binding CsgD family transcriptional regulator
VYAFDEAAACLDSALGLMDAAGWPARERAAASIRLAKLLYESGFDNYPRCLAAYATALRLFEQVGDAVGMGHAQLGRGRIYSFAAATMDLPKALFHLTEAARLLSATAPSSNANDPTGSLAQVALWQLRTDAGLELARRAYELAQQQGKEAAIWSPAVQMSFHLIGLGRLEAGFEWADRACASAEAVNQTFAGFASAVWSGARCFWLAAPREAQAYYQRELPRPRLAFAPLRWKALLGDLAAALVLAGDLDQAERLVTEEIDDDVLDQGAETYARPLVAFYRGDLPIAEALWLAAAQHHERAGNRWSKATFDFWLARLQRLKGDARLAEARLRSCLDVTFGVPHLPLAVWAAAELAVLLADLERITEADALLELCQRVVGNGENWRGLDGHVSLAEAAIAARKRTPSAAGASFERAQAIFRRYSLPWDEAETLRVWGAALLSQASRVFRAQAVEKFDAAEQIYRSRGAGEPWLQRVHGQRTPVAHVLPGGLTEREVEVLRLLAQGRSSREIGQQLVLSVRTVERHVANIYLKTGTHGRAQATAYALAKRLA